MTTAPATIKPVRFRRAPVVTEAVRWDGTPEHATALIRWMESDPERGDLPEAESAYWVEHEADRDRYVMGFRSFGSTDYATAGDWIVRDTAGVYTPTPDAIFRALHTEVDPMGPIDRARDRFTIEMLLGVAAITVIFATLGNGAFLWYTAGHVDASTVPTFALAISLFLNIGFIIVLSRVVRAIRKRVT